MTTVNLQGFQKGITCSGIKIFNSLPSNIQHLRNDKALFKNGLHTYLSTCSINEFLEHGAG
jgi:hypothetical protein